MFSDLSYHIYLLVSFLVSLLFGLVDRVRGIGGWLVVIVGVVVIVIPSSSVWSGGGHIKGFPDIDYVILFIGISLSISFFCLFLLEGGKGGRLVVIGSCCCWIFDIVSVGHWVKFYIYPS